MSVLLSDEDCEKRSWLNLDDSLRRVRITNSMHNTWGYILTCSTHEDEEEEEEEDEEEEEEDEEEEEEEEERKTVRKKERKKQRNKEKRKQKNRNWTQNCDLERPLTP